MVMPLMKKCLTNQAEVLWKWNLMLSGLDRITHLTWFIQDCNYIPALHIILWPSAESLLSFHESKYVNFLEHNILDQLEALQG